MYLLSVLEMRGRRSLGAASMPRAMPMITCQQSSTPIYNVVVTKLCAIRWKQYLNSARIGIQTSSFAENAVRQGKI
ncbi:unnamed protein product [Gongylonema pulchrum]|uniref:Secreted protein n=1 Tax=Gongylonema pulchrum TaxID=637853 RepID=A0A183CXH8_9BILA|nr:unnamed protein product [Gongylonema pulchrum]VDN42805.1 unnamed protein product [Gongylonema pulchrum]